MYENIFTQYSKNFDGLTVYSLSGASVGINHPTLRDDGKYASVTQSIPFGVKIIFTGRYLQSQSGYFCYQIIYYTSGGSYNGYIWNDEFSKFTKDIPETSENVKTQNIINSLITNNQMIVENNLLCARIFEYCKQRGVVLPVKDRQTLYNLQARLIQRDQKIKSSGYVLNYEEGVSPEFSVYNQSLINFMNNPGIGIVISGTVAIIISIVLIAGTFAAAYALFKSLHAESVVDYKYSADLTAKLVKLLPPDVYKQLMSENEANLKAAQKAIDAASGKSIFTTLKYFAVGFAGFYLVDKFLATRKN